MPIPALLAAAPGLLQAGASLFGGGKRRREQRAAQQQFDADQAALRNFQFENPYANLENTAEDLTVNQQAAQFQAQEANRGLAQGLDAIVAGGGGGGGAQAIAQAALQSSQGISADIARQETANQFERAKQAATNQLREAQGFQTLQNQQYGQAQQNLGQSQQRLSAANAARQQATQSLVSGLGSAVGGFAGAGGFGGGASQAATATAGAGGGGDVAANFLANTEQFTGGVPDLTGFGEFTSGQGLNFDPNAPFPRSPFKNTGKGPKKREYGGTRQERKEFLDRVLAEEFGHDSLIQLQGNLRPGQSRFDQQYNIGGQTVKIDPTTGEFIGQGARRAEEFLSNRANYRYEQEYNRELERLGLKSAKDAGAYQGASGAAQDALTRSGELNPYRVSSEGKYTHTDALLEDRAPTTKKKKKERPSSWKAHMKRTKKLHDSLNKKSPTKRTPFYRTKWMGGVTKM